MDKQEQQGICREIGARTGGDIYIGVVGPVRSGKSTFIKRFMEQLVLPAMSTEAARLRARDELPQSAAGRTIMTTEPKFIPETAVPLQLEGGGVCRVRLIDCVGYMVEGAMGHEENEKPRMVKSPWFDEEVPFDLAAETGTRRVIREHSTIGIVITTDGTVSDIPRAGYAKTEKRVIEELDTLGKPYVILLRFAGELRGSGRRRAGGYFAAGAVRIPGAGAGSGPAPVGQPAGERPLAAGTGVHRCDAAGREHRPHEGRPVRHRSSIRCSANRPGWRSATKRA